MYNTYMVIHIEEIKHKIIPILKQAGITRSSVFGSYVRGEQHSKSDIDLLVEFPDGLSLFDVAEIKYALENTVGRKVDLVDFSSIKPRLKPYIMSEQIQIL